MTNADAAFTRSLLSYKNPSCPSPAGPSAHRIEPRWCREPIDQGSPFDLVRAGISCQQISLLVDIVANNSYMFSQSNLFSPGLFGGKAREIVPGNLPEPFLAADVET